MRDLAVMLFRFAWALWLRLTGRWVRQERRML
jgi:hypothetical protein